jgi:hypothetical protein
MIASFNNHELYFSIILSFVNPRESSIYNWRFAQLVVPWWVVLYNFCLKYSVAYNQEDDMAQPVRREMRIFTIWVYGPEPLPPGPIPISVRMKRHPLTPEEIQLMREFEENPSVSSVRSGTFRAGTPGIK